MFDLYCSASGPRFLEILQRISGMPFAKTYPDELSLNYAPESVDARWREVLASATRPALALWRDQRAQIDFVPGSEVVSFTVSQAYGTFDEMVTIVEDLQFETLVVGTGFSGAWREMDLDRIGIGRSNHKHGIAIAFRAGGHDRLVSRRWLDYGPWRVVRRPDDTTWVQFYDLAIMDPWEAYSQAWPGHQRMGNSPTGGYIGFHDGGLIADAVREGGLYDPTTRTLELVVAPGITVEQGAMLAQCARRRADPKIDSVAYVFMDRGDAEAHLRELWLRELQCWYVDGTGKHRLDDRYDPGPPNPPAWVRALDG